MTRFDDPAPDGCAPGDCSLREAIIAANGTAITENIVLGVGTYTLSIGGTGEDAAATGDLDITDDLLIQGQGRGASVIDGGNLDRVLDIDPSSSGIDVQIRSVTVQHGARGGISSQAKMTTLWDSDVILNTGNGFTGGIRNGSGTMSLVNVMVRDNATNASGGGVTNAGTMTMTNTTISGNQSSIHGGGVRNLGTMTMTNSTVSGNQAFGDGGGLNNEVGAITLTNVTIASNIADSDTSGTGDGGGVNTTGTLSFKNTILAGNQDVGGEAPDCNGTINSQGYNLLGNDTGCTFGAAAGDQVGTGAAPIDPLLGPLQNNGGPTDTRALLAGSPAIDAGTNTGCPTMDQRGYRRPFDSDGNGAAACDIGAFELSDDFDGDGCSDAEETGPNPAFGGGRDLTNFWDFFDTPDPTNVRDKIISVGDIFRVVGRFGYHDAGGGTPINRNTDPLSAPPPSGYHPAFDRGPPSPGGDPWDLNPADGSVTIGDIFLAVGQYGHTCA